MYESLGPARRRVLRAVSELGGAGPVTLTDIVGRLGGHPNTTRQQLDRLVASGLLDVTAVSHGRPGRPPKTYTLTDRGRRSLDQHYSGLVGAVTTHLAGQPDPEEAARAVGRSWGASSVADRIGEPVRVVVELLDILGFDPRPTGPGDDVVLTSCPLVGHCGPSPLVCELHQGMLDGALRELGHSQGVRLVPFSHPEGCGVSFSELDEQTSSAAELAGPEPSPLAQIA